MRKVFKSFGGCGLGIALTIDTVYFCACIDFFLLIYICECICVMLTFELLLFGLFLWV